MHLKSTVKKKQPLSAKAERKALALKAQMRTELVCILKRLCMPPSTLSSGANVTKKRPTTIAMDPSSTLLRSGTLDDPCRRKIEENASSSERPNKRKWNNYFRFINWTTCRATPSTWTLKPWRPERPNWSGSFIKFVEGIIINLKAYNWRWPRKTR